MAGLGSAGTSTGLGGGSNGTANSSGSLVGALLVLSPVHGELDCGLLSLSADVAHALGGALHLRHMLAEYRAGEEILYVSWGNSLVRMQGSLGAVGIGWGLGLKSGLGSRLGLDRRLGPRCTPC